VIALNREKWSIIEGLVEEFYKNLTTRVTTESPTLQGGDEIGKFIR
jgi:hypothetical protein